MAPASPARRSPGCVSSHPCWPACGRCAPALRSRRRKRAALADLLAAARVILSRPNTRALIAFPAGAAAIEGAIDLLVVVLAVQILAIGPGAAGYLSAAFGAGGLLGAAVAVAVRGPPARAACWLPPRSSAVWLSAHWHWSPRCSSRCCCWRSWALRAPCRVSPPRRCCSAPRRWM